MPGVMGKKNVRSALIAGALGLAAAGLLLRPQECVQAGREGIALCLDVIVPSLFPFFVLSSLVVELGLARALGRAMERWMRPLFRVGGAGASALALGLVGGYPVGARTAVGLYESGQCSRTETLRLLAFCNNSGPAFILGVVGAGVFRSGRAGLILYLVHAAASLCVGLLFRFWGGKEEGGAGGGAPVFRSERLSRAFPRSVWQAARSAGHICAYVLLFSVAVRLLYVCGAMEAAAHIAGRALSWLGVDEGLAGQLLCGMMEVTSGVTGLAGLGGPRLGAAAFLLGWAGLSVHCQVLSFLSESGLPAGTYLAGKALHGLLSALLVWALRLLLPGAVPALSPGAQAAAAPGFCGALALSAGCALAVTLVFLLAMGAGEKKSGNRRRMGV